MPLRYRTLQVWARSGVFTVFRRIEVTGRSKLPKDRPAILAANHSNALADVALLVAKMPKFPQFLAAATWWKWPPVRWLFRFGGVVPVHRRREGETDQNESSFRACHAALGAGAHVAIFPEGEMHVGHGLLPIKTGAARIALGAAAEAGVAGIVIVPVGLVYDDRGRWRSEVEVHFGDPIEIDEWVELYGTDPTKAVRAVTDLLAERLAEATVENGPEAEAALIDQAAALALADAPPGGPGCARRNELRRALTSSITITGLDPSEELSELRAAVGAHTTDLQALGLGNEDGVPALAPLPSRERSRTAVELVALAPPAIIGAFANAPTVGVVALANWQVRNESWKATTQGVGGTFLSPAVWAFEYVALARLLGRRRALVLTAAGAVGGVAMLAWIERWRRWQQIKWRDDVDARDPALLAKAAASRAALRERQALLVDDRAAVVLQ